MKVGFYIPGYEHVGIGYLSAALKQAGHETIGFFDPMICNEGIFRNRLSARVLDLEDYVVEQIVQSDLHLLAFSVVTNNYPRICRIARKVKKRRGIKTVFGGIHCSSVPDQVIKNPDVDFLVVGEGEEAIVDLANQLETSGDVRGIPNLWHKVDGEVLSSPPRPLVEDLDALPFPDREVFYRAAPAFLRKSCPVTATRGWPFACTFCRNSWMRSLYKGKGRWRRRRSVDNVLRELEAVRDAYDGYDIVRFWDDVFIDDRKWLREFAAQYPQVIGTPFFCFGQSKFIDEESVALLERAGCRELNIGVESVDEGARRTLLHRADSNEEITRAIDLVRPTRIFLSTGNLLRLPGQTIDDALHVAQFYSENRVDLPHAYYFQYYPSTKIVSIAVDRGLLTDSQVADIENPQEGKGSFWIPEEDGRRADFSRVRTLIHLTPVLPQKLIRRMIERGWWRFLPSLDLYPLVFFPMTLIKRLRTGKRFAAQNYTAFRYLQVMLACGLKKAALLVKRRFRE
ncbi:MAG TPA: B12-binding domain-containing radical SAM protein [Candidatus Hydrogenedentes bacterium]|nr:B12-binding domain-containing radical SAM protein [Candidatus Hydrogenedentota bacterium]HIJ73213.1 B12-binding domain-containing radical SAM protein [Candidatus Hydrogenedentota bacterium]